MVYSGSSSWQRPILSGPVARWLGRLSYIRLSVELAARKILGLVFSPSLISSDLLDEVVVSMTTHGPRLASISHVLECLSWQSSKPTSVRLYIGFEDLRQASARTKRMLARYCSRGLTVYPVEDLGPHTKYWYAALSMSDRALLVTGDDDTLYPRYWLQRLVDAHERLPHAVVCHRAHKIRIDGSGLQTYRTWGPVATQVASVLHFATGVSGILYPAAAVRVLRSSGTAFLQLSPSADDVWLSYLMIGAGIATAQVGRQPKEFRSLPSASGTGLARNNVVLGANDSQISATLGQPAILQKLRREVSDCPLD